MRWKLVAGVILFFSLIEFALGAVLFGPTLLSSMNSTSAAKGGTPQATPTTGNVILRENAWTGSNGWVIPAGRQATTQIQAYADATSVLPGKVLTFYVSTQQNGTQYWLDIYRLGWYGGLGGRMMRSIGMQVGHAQGSYNAITHELLSCLSCVIDQQTKRIEANWQPSYALTIPTDWTTGIYLAKFTDAAGMQTYVPFDVLGNFSSDYVVVTPDTTYEAYNDWGGSSLYDTDNSLFGESDGQSKAVKVSFDRPYSQEAGSSQVLVFEADAIHWLERQGYDLSYISNVDLDKDPAQLLHHKADISIGHDEYWTKAMRDGVERARDSGVGVAFLGANVAYWQVRFEPDSRGNAYRTVICYKVSTNSHNLALDPAYPKDIPHVTAQWRDPVLNRPENAMIGTMYSDLTHKQVGFSWQVSTGANSFLLNGTGLQAGQHYGCDLVGYEWDRVFANGATPKNLHILGRSGTVADNNATDESDTTYYVAPSGALVFAAGAIYWTYALDSYRLHVDPLCAGQDLVVPGLQQLMAKVMDALIVHHTQQS
jgi:hypothetical protein